MTGDWSIEELSSRRPRQSRFDRLSPRLTEGSTQGALLPATWPVDGAAAFKAAYIAQDWSESSMRSTRGWPMRLEKPVLMSLSATAETSPCGLTLWITDLRVWQWTRRPREPGSRCSRRHVRVTK